MKTQWLVVGMVAALVAGVIFVAFAYSNSKDALAPAVVTNFEECKNAGYPIMEIYPEQCRAPNGELFVRIIDEPIVEPDPVPSLVPTAVSFAGTGTVQGSVTIGPICPVEREGVPCVVPSETYTSRNVVIYATDQVTVIKQVALDAGGNYSLTLPTGIYWVQIQPAGIGVGEMKFVEVKASTTSSLDFDIDTGIR